LTKYSKFADKYGEVAVYKDFEHHGHAVLAEPGWEVIAEYSSVWLKKAAPTKPNIPVLAR
jgi:hypothetical protein